MANPTLIVPSVEATIRGQRVLADEVVVRLPVNELATVTLSAHFEADAAAGERAQVAPLESFIAETGAFQGYLFREAAGTVDAQVVVQTSIDGEASRLQFDGVVAGGGHALAGNSMGRTYRIAHRASLLGLWDGSIYGHYLDQFLVEEGPVVGSIAHKIDETITRLLNPPDGLEAKWNLLAREAVIAARYARLHEINQTVIGEVRALLAASDTTTQQDTLDRLGPTHQVDIVRYIRNALVNHASFLEAVTGELAQAFGLQFVCDTWSGGVGQLSNLELVNTAPVRVEVSHARISTDVGGRREPPLIGLTVEALIDDQYLTGSAEPKKAGLPAILEQYPEVFSGQGRVRSIGKPVWMRAELGVQPLVSAEEPDIPSFDQTQSQIIADAKRSSDAYRPVLREWARRHYHYLALLPSQAHASIPLNLNLRPGQVIELVDRDSGVSLLVGYVAEVEHRITSRGQASSAGTTVRLSHVRIGGFSLP